MPQPPRTNPRASSRHNPPSASAFPTRRPSDPANPPASSFRWKQAPKGPATRRRLRAMGLRPGGHDPVAQVICRGGKRVACLYRVDRAKPIRPMTLDKEAALDNAVDWTDFVKRNWTGYITSCRNAGSDL
ncbi:RRQRL motif-containing zinc-binding protein [Streptomyces sp. NPDC000348]|uniref:RRQRL motif-containing zinc-binding protein n=1 Tax=Streptomyces sp. NPDC000348 TaxID=3364538 RepID=UPI0036A5046C